MQKATNLFWFVILVNSEDITIMMSSIVRVKIVLKYGNHSQNDIRNE